jgi:hypothetical protein
MRFREIRAFGEAWGIDCVDPELRATTTFRETREATSPLSNRAARRAQDRYKGHKRGAIRRAIRRTYGQHPRPWKSQTEAAE